MLETKRLTLRPTTEAEMRAYIAATAEPALQAAYGEMLQGCLDHPEQWVWYALWEIAGKDGGPVGDLCFKGLNDAGAVEIGYGILEAHQNRGYATEAVRAAVNWALHQPGVHRVEAETEPDNLASQRVLQKCGFVETGERGEEGPRWRYAPEGA